MTSSRPDPAAFPECIAHSVPFPMLQRVNVVGTSGSGKTTFARRLARVLGSIYVEMDAVFWEPDWTEPDDETFFARLRLALAAQPEARWVLDGNYTRSIPIKWASVGTSAPTVIWLDYGFGLTLWRAIRRAVGRGIRREELWPGTGNRESLLRLFTRKSIVLWTIRSHGRTRSNYEALSSDPRHAHIRFVRLRTPRAAEDFMRSLEAGRLPAELRDGPPGVARDA